MNRGAAPMSSICLRRDNTFVYVEQDAWWPILETAEECGWKPAGTVASPEWDEPWDDNPSHCLRAILEPWDGNYHDPLGQIVTETDAAQFANALSAFLDTITMSHPYFFAIEDVAVFAKRGGFSIEE